MEMKMQLPKNVAAKKKVLAGVADGAKKSTYTALKVTIPLLEEADVTAEASEDLDRRRRLQEVDRRLADSKIAVKVTVNLDEKAAKQVGGGGKDMTSHLSAVSKAVTKTVTDNKAKIQAKVVAEVKAVVEKEKASGSADFASYTPPATIEVKDPVVKSEVWTVKPTTAAPATTAGPSTTASPSTTSPATTAAATTTLPPVVTTVQPATTAAVTTSLMVPSVNNSSNNSSNNTTTITPESSATRDSMATVVGMIGVLLAFSTL